MNKGYDCSILGNYQISIDVKTVDITDTLRDTVVNTITVYVDNFATEQTTKAFIISSSSSTALPASLTKTSNTDMDLSISEDAFFFISSFAFQ